VSQPLAGRRVVVTRPVHQAGALIERLEALGAQVLALPLTEIVPVEGGPELDAAIAALDGYAAVVVTSVNGAGCLREQLRRRGRTIPSHVLVAAVGAATAARLADGGVHVDLVPPRATGAAVAAALAERGVAGSRILLARARGGRPELVDGLRRAGATVDDVALYDTVRLRPDPAEVDAALAEPEATLVVLTAPSAVEVLAGVAGPGRAGGVRAVTIGPTTSSAARAAGMTVTAQAAEQSVDGLVAAVRAAAV